MAELPLETEETASDLPEGLIPPEIEDDGDTEPVETPQGQVAPASYGPVLLRERYLIDSGQPIVELDTPSAKAYVVEDRRDLRSQLYGLVCTPGLPVRLNAIKLLKTGHVDNVLPLIEWDTVMAQWPHGRDEEFLRFAPSLLFIYSLVVLRLCTSPILACSGDTRQTRRTQAQKRR